MKWMKHRARVIVATGLLLVTISVHGQERGLYPVRPIRLIVPTTPGGPPDVVARVIGEKLAAAVGQPVVIENRPGASGAIGLEALAKAVPDGYTLGVIGMPFIAVTPNLVAKLPYDTLKDFTPIALVAWNYNILVVPAASPATSVAQLIAATKAKPGTLRFSSGGNGTPAHLVGELLKREAKIEILHVPYKGAPAAVGALFNGEADLMIGFVGALSTYIKAGRLRALATSAPQRIAGYPELPTFVELGYSQVVMRDWQGIFAPTGTAQSIIDRLQMEIARATGAASVKERLEALGLELSGVGSQQAVSRIKSDVQQWGRLIRDLGIKAD
jgi:tripartite-type tricarboxylate transporter receptor subunit TctC